MKIKVLIGAIVFLFVLSALLASNASAQMLGDNDAMVASSVNDTASQQRVVAQAVSNMFGDPGTCLANLGRVPYYEPLYLGNVSKNPANGKDRIVAPIEGDACVHMVTMRGWKWVPQKSGTQLRWDIKADGTRVPYAHDHCGNNADGIVYPPPPVAPSATPLVDTTTRGVNIHVDGEIHVIHEGEVGIVQLPPQPMRTPQPRLAVAPPHHSWCGTMCKVGIAVGVAAVVGYAATRKGNEGRGPGGNTGTAF